MYNRLFHNYLMSTEYYDIEKDKIYQQLTNLLLTNLPSDIYLSVEELLHAEILYKIEEGFKAGYFVSENYKQKYRAK